MRENECVTSEIHNLRYRDRKLKICQTLPDYRIMKTNYLYVNFTEKATPL